MANLCPVCGGKMGLLNRERSADGLICASCMNFFYSKVGFQASKFSTKELADFWAVQEKRRKQFKETDSLYDADALYVSVDDKNELFYFGRRSGDKGPRMIYAFDEVSGYESDSEDFTVTQTRGGIGRAVVGAAIAGPVGAIVGASTAKTETRKGKGKENITISFELPFGKKTLSAQTYPAGMTALLKACMEKKSQTQSTYGRVNSVADELLKFKQLLDMGAITQEEYNVKKSQLLEKGF